MDDKSLARQDFNARLTRYKSGLLNRLHARLGGFARPVTAFVSQPEPKTIGSFTNGLQLIAGNFLFDGFLVEAPGRSPWLVTSPDPAFEREAHGFAWLDDLAAVGDRSARELAQWWLLDWIDAYGRGKGPGWEPDLAGRRLIRWINHKLFLLKGMEKAQSDRFYRSLARHTRFVAKRWTAAEAGYPRFEALTGMIYAGLSLEGADHLVGLSARALGQECADRIDAGGGIPSRNPEELMEIFTLLNWAASALSEEGNKPDPRHLAAIERIAPTLRTLRHGDGSLARFHGGGRGAEGRLDQALAASGIRARLSGGTAMGFSRLASGRTCILMDTSPPPIGEGSLNAHASTLAFELTSGRKPFIVNCGSGRAFGAEWRRAARATPSHSTLSIDNFSSSRFAPRKAGGLVDRLIEGPKKVELRQMNGYGGVQILATHNGYATTHGLHHVRRLDLSLDGRNLSGNDTLGALSEADRALFEDLMDRTKLKGVDFAVRFHLHPDCSAELDLGGNAVSITFQDHEVWVFRHEGAASLALSPSVYLERGRLKPRATKQIVLSDKVFDYSSQISWTLQRVQDSQRSFRDVEAEQGLTSE